MKRTYVKPLGRRNHLTEKTDRSLDNQPSFESSTPTTVKVQLGQTAYLNCQVNNIGDRTVTWYRRKDYQILTVDTYTYTRDIRYKSIHQPNANTWTLEIKFTKKSDSGYYECQVNSEPKISKSVNLILLAAKAYIIGSPALNVKTGSTINLKCQVTDSTEVPIYVFWYHNNKVIDYDNPSGRITFETANKRNDYRSSSVISELNVVSAKLSDSGDYKCAPSYTVPASINVRVIEDDKILETVPGEIPAAVQYGPHSSSNQDNLSIYLFTLAALYLQLIIL
ncbi:Uncharacterised protein g788 [Pycnogonum litorale]